MMQQQTFPWLHKTSHAILSEDRVYRYALYRSLDGEGWNTHEPHQTICFILLNPSTADEEANDPTIEKLMKYARAWGYRRLIVVNLFAYRETDSTKLRSLASTRDIVGPFNNAYIDQVVSVSHRVVCGWGNQGEILGRGDAMRRHLIPLLADRGDKPYCFKQNANSSPVHPLYQRDAAELVELR